MSTQRKSLSKVIPQIFIVFFIVTILKNKSYCNSQQLLMRTTNYGVIPAVKCFALDPSFVEFKTCLLKPINRTCKIIYGHAILLQPIKKNVLLNFRILKKANGGYKPFGIDVTLDPCKYLEGKKNPVFDWIFDLAAPYTNINHSCPYDSDIFVEYPIKQATLPSVFPDGEYRFEFQFFTFNVSRVAVHVYFILKETEQMY